MTNATQRDKMRQNHWWNMRNKYFDGFANKEDGYPINMLDDKVPLCLLRILLLLVE